MATSVLARPWSRNLAFTIANVNSTFDGGGTVAAVNFV